jgi:hypothetical protein
LVNANRECRTVAVHAKKNDFILVDELIYIFSAQQDRANRLSPGQTAGAPYRYKPTSIAGHGRTKPVRIGPLVAVSINVSSSENVLSVH